MFYSKKNSDICYNDISSFVPVPVVLMTVAL